MEAATDLQKLEIILKHIKMVESNMQSLAKKLLPINKNLALELIVRSRKHDLSKVESNIEFENLNDNAKQTDFQLALTTHQKSNNHHPEFHGSIHNMKEIDIIEMVCDCTARGQEFGTDVKEWFENSATKKYNFKMSDNVGVLISHYLMLLLTPKFSKL